MRPTVSIMLLCYNNLDYTKRCVAAVRENTPPGLYELIVIDNASFDETPQYLAALQRGMANLKVVTYPKNLGFCSANNEGAKVAEGKYLFLLNNDAEVQEGWLEPLLDVMEKSPTVGVVGSKLIYPDGRLQEAGAMLFRDATGWNFGRFDEPDEPEYSYVREVDYVSGTALMVRADLWRRLGGLDTRFDPAYWDDPDLCWSVRKAGYRVLYHPDSRVVHHEGLTCGTDTKSGRKKYQDLHRDKFLKKWAEEMKQQPPASTDVKVNRRAADRRCRGGKQVLVAADEPPQHDRQGGGLRLFNFMRMLLEAGHHVTFVGRNTIWRPPDVDLGPYIKELQDMGVLVYALDRMAIGPEGTPDVRSMARILTGREYDVALLFTAREGAWFVERIQKHSPSTRIVVDSVDVGFCREGREAALLSSPRLWREYRAHKAIELVVYQRVDAILTITEAERGLLSRYVPAGKIFHVPDLHPLAEGPLALAERQGVVLVAGFRHPPNVDAAHFLLDEVMPIVREKLPDVRLAVVGDSPPESIRQRADEHTVVTGYVPEIDPYIAAARVAVVPVRYGAGIKGKIIKAMAAGTPNVTTRVGADGMELDDGTHVLIRDDPAGFADAVVRLCTDDALWEHVSAAGRDFAKARYSAEVTRSALFAGLFPPVPPPDTSLSEEIHLFDRIAEAYRALRGQTFDTAEELFADIVARFPESCDGYLGLAQVRLAREDPRGAKVLLEKALQASQHKAAACVAVGDLLKDMGETSAALKLFDKATALDPGFAPAWTALARLHSSSKQWQQAERSWSQVVNLDPRNLDAWVIRARTNWRLGHRRQGLADYSRASAIAIETRRYDLALTIDREMSALAAGKPVPKKKKVGQRMTAQYLQVATLCEAVGQAVGRQGPVSTYEVATATQVLEALHAGHIRINQAKEKARGIEDVLATLARLQLNNHRARAGTLDAFVTCASTWEGTGEQRSPDANEVRRDRALASEARAADSEEPPALSSAPPSGEVDIVIPIYDNPGTVRRCVESVLETAPRASLILVDDCSPDEAIPALVEEFARLPNVRTVRTRENQGFIGACHAGAQLAAAPFILFLNSDVECPEPGWLEALTPTDPQVAIVGARLLYPPDLGTPWAGTVQHAGVARDAQGQPYHALYRQPASHPLANRAHDVNAVTAACMLIRRTVWEELGGFDTAFGRGMFEDVDLCWRARRQGHRIRYEPKATLYHREHGSSRHGRSLHDENAQRNLRLLLVQWGQQPSDEGLFRDQAPAEETPPQDAGPNWPEEVATLVRQADERVSSGDLEAGLEALTQALAIRPEDKWLIVTRGLVMRRLGQPEAARKEFAKAASLAPRHAPAHVALADVLIELGRPKEAQAAAGRVLALNPADTGALKLLARACLDDGRYEEGVKAYFEALKRDPEDVDTLVALGNCYFEADDRDTAQKLYEQALKIDPDSQVAADNLAVAKGRAGREPARPAVALGEPRSPARPAVALGEPRSPVQPDAQDDHHLLKQVQALVARGDEDGVIDLFTQALQENPADTNALKLLAAFCLKTERYAEAVQAYLEVLKHEPDDVEVLLILGNCYFQAGDRDSARTVYERALRADPDNAVAAENLAIVNSGAAEETRVAAETEVHDVRSGAPDASHGRLASGHGQDARATDRDLVSIVIVTYNSAPTIRACLESVFECTRAPFEVIVVDNASRDETRAILEPYATHAGPARGRAGNGLHSTATILNAENRGFATACNQGIRASKGAYVVLLNPDTVVTHGWLLRMRDHFRRDVGAVGPLSDYVAGLQKVELNLSKQMPPGVGLNEVAQILARENTGRAVETKLLVGFCMMLPRSVLDQVGLLDEDLFLGNDDLELSWRLRQRGYRLLVAADTFVHHEGQVSFASEDDTRTSTLVQESTDRLYAKLVARYGEGNVPHPLELWGIDWFRPTGADFRPHGPSAARGSSATNERAAADPVPVAPGV